MQTDDDSFSVTPPSLKSKLKSFFFSCCSRRNYHNRCQVLDSPPLPPLQGAASNTPSDDKPALIWLNTRDLKHEIKDRFATIFSGMGSGIINKHRRYNNSAEFRYDPLSYSLNFEDGVCDGDEELPLGKFCSRLPSSPPVKSAVVKEITAAG